MRRAASAAGFVTAEAVHMHDDWSTSSFDSVCFAKRKWVLYVQQRPGLPRRQAFSSGGFSRYPLSAVVVPNRTSALEAHLAGHDGCWHAGTTFVADLRHGGGATMGIAHFAKRILRLHALQRDAARYGLPPVGRVAFPATSAAHLRHSWPASMLKLVAPTAAALPVDELSRTQCCFEHLVTSARENTYFLRRRDADVLRSAAYALAGVPPMRSACAPLRGCYFQRSEGKQGGRWEGGARVVVNKLELLRLMREGFAAHGVVSAAYAVDVVNINSTHTFGQQVALYASCVLMVSVHGSQNANLMFMRPGSAFMEVTRAPHHHLTPW